MLACSSAGVDALESGICLGPMALRGTECFTVDMAERTPVSAILYDLMPEAWTINRERSAP